jgi:hypothetical protein
VSPVDRLDGVRALEAGVLVQVGHLEPIDKHKKGLVDTTELNFLLKSFLKKSL